MAEISEFDESQSQAYVCKTCEGQFIIPRSETAVCCPICRMNRIAPVD